VNGGAFTCVSCDGEGAGLKYSKLFSQVPMLCVYLYNYMCNYVFSYVLTVMFSNLFELCVFVMCFGYVLSNGCI
jgi:hypothetical protein